ncbi:MAG: hypothetical protein RSE00_00315 [Clostridia bacterium]
MEIAAVILAVISMITTFFPYTGIVVGIIGIVLSTLSIKKSINDNLKGIAKIALTITIITTIVSVIYTSITFVTFTVKEKTLIKDTDITIIKEESKALQESVDEYISNKTVKKGKKKTKDLISKEDAIKEISSKEHKDIYKLKEDIKNWNEVIRGICATKDSGTIYYDIDYNNLNSSIQDDNKTFFVIDSSGKVYLNIKDISKYKNDKTLSDNEYIL